MAETVFFSEIRRSFLFLQLRDMCNVYFYAHINTYISCCRELLFLRTTLYVIYVYTIFNGEIKIVRLYVTHTHTHTYTHTYTL